MIRAVGLISTGLAAIVSLALAAAIWASQAGPPGSTVWPLPALVLIDWALLGLAAFGAVSLALWRGRDSLLAVPWVAFGGMVPLIILGALSIGPLVALSAAFVLVPSALFAVRHKQAFLSVVGLVLAGAVANLALLFLFIVLAGGVA